MRAVVQRVRQAFVVVDGQEISRIGTGLCCLIGVEAHDGERDIDHIVRKICGLRVFDDEQGAMNLDVGQIRGDILLISQFTLLGDARKGKRPSYSAAEQPAKAAELFQRVVEGITELHSGKVVTGRFQTMMDVHIVNHGPVTILLDSRKLF